MEPRVRAAFNLKGLCRVFKDTNLGMNYIQALLWSSMGLLTEAWGTNLECQLPPLNQTRNCPQVPRHLCGQAGSFL